jgi:hypothetical protein
VAVFGISLQWRIVALSAAVALGGCGGGGGDDSGTAKQAAAATVPSRPVAQTDLQIAQSIYGGTRTPADFYADPAPSGHGYVATSHLKNTDLGVAASVTSPQYELCTNDWNEAFGWSELSAQNAPQYADLVVTNEDPRYFEFGRARSGEPQIYLRGRIYKCAYLDRSLTDLRTASGDAGQINRRPLTAAELKTLSEYLWQFTIYNNTGHAVLKSDGSSNDSGLAHTLYIANLVRNGVSGNCDRIDVVAWRHTAELSTGRMQLDVQSLWSFGARDSAGVAQLCSG